MGSEAVPISLRNGDTRSSSPRCNRKGNALVAIIAVGFRLTAWSSPDLGRGDYDGTLTGYPLQWPNTAHSDAPRQEAIQLTGYGYAGAIEVLMGVAPDGRLTGVRVLSHRETPGLGDKIEVQKDNWIEEFSGRSLSDPTPDRWKVQRDGGEFDQFSGATITPRAVVSTVHRGLAFAALRQAALFAPLAEPTETTAKREER